MENKDVIALLDELYAMITEAWPVPLGNDKCIIERAKAVELINGIKEALPGSIAESKRLVAARDEFINNAKREAEAVRKNAEEQQKSMVDEQEIVRLARAKSDELISSAEAFSRKLRGTADEYVDRIMSNSEKSISDALNLIQTAHKLYTSYMDLQRRGESPSYSEN